MKENNKVCLNCSKGYYTKPSWVSKSKYCSRKCHSESMVHPVKKVGRANCLRCSKEFTDRPHKIKKRMFCSISCKNIHQKPSLGKLNKDHNQFKNGIGVYRREALKFYGKKCQKCHSGERLEVHHIDENRTNNEMSNLSVLCITCHNMEHRTHIAKRICPSCNKEFFKKSRPSIKYCCRACFFQSRRKK